nr:hypothetical protein [Tanacetum cinerariifolium]
SVGCSSSLADLYLTEKELHQLHLDEEALRETLEEKAMDEKVIGEGGYGNDITVGAAMILANVPVFTPTPSKHYLNIKKRNVVKVFRKDTVSENGSG